MIDVDTAFALMDEAVAEKGPDHYPTQCIYFAAPAGPTTLWAHPTESWVPCCIVGNALARTGVKPETIGHLNGSLVNKLLSGLGVRATYDAARAFEIAQAVQDGRTGQADGGPIPDEWLDVAGLSQGWAHAADIARVVLGFSPVHWTYNWPYGV